MRDNDPGIDIPPGWEATTYRLTGNFKLVAQFEHMDSGAEVRVTPYKTYAQPGFCNAHRVVLVDPDEGVKELAIGMDVELVEEAEQVAKEAMKESRRE
jgi:hypothetical protein